MKHEKLSSRRKLEILAKFIIDTCSLDEIDMLCIGLLHSKLCMMKPE